MVEPPWPCTVPTWPCTVPPWLHEPDAMFSACRQSEVVGIETHHSMLLVYSPPDSVLCVLLPNQEHAVFLRGLPSQVLVAPDADSCSDPTRNGRCLGALYLQITLYS
ncbi:hypothetical protein AVEN_66123-1 [Araneus ventricosus]|uniref:Uncharacterized protein n=1 Tax=Araneus ventricosus TaxID=182803 RepID=A0A4Y2HHX9_ARAVE|nr:hypothetical protein AVEN_66123-1 [Araneus ventricosus]